MRIVTTTKVNSAVHPSGVTKSSTSFGWGKGGKVTAAGWQVTLCGPKWHVISRSGVVKFHELLYTVYFNYFMWRPLVSYYNTESYNAACAYCFTELCTEYLTK